MKTKFKKLLEFVDKKTDWKENLDTTNDMVIDAFLNFDAQDESLNVGKNEQLKEFCSCICDDGVEEVLICNLCKKIVDLTKND